MINLFDRISRLKAVEREYLVVKQAVDRLRNSVIHEGDTLTNGTSPKDLIAAVDRLEATYLIRLWAEFETAVRSYYESSTNNPIATIRATDLINSVAGRRKGRSIDRPISDPVHRVREYRNSLVHDRNDQPPPVDVTVARRHLNNFLGRLIDYKP